MAKEGKQSARKASASKASASKASAAGAGKKAGRTGRRKQQPTPAPVGAPASTPVAVADGEEINQAAAYDVRVVPADVAAEVVRWRVVLVRHLSPSENQGKHNVFVDAVDEQGQRVRNAALRIFWSWEGQRPDEHADPKPLDKPDNEPAGNVDINSTGTHVTVWLQGDGLPSDRVENLNTNHPDEPGPHGEKWNTVGHHSYYVRFQRGALQPVTEPTTGQPTTGQPTTGEPGTGEPAQPGQPGGKTDYNIYLPFVTGGTGAASEGTDGKPAPNGGADSGGQAGTVPGTVPDTQPGGSEDLAPPADLTVTPGPNAGPDEQALAALWNRYGGVLLREAVRLNIDPGVAAVVLLLESSGTGFGEDGRMTIRFENHIFYHYWGSQHPAEFGARFGFDPGHTWQGHLWRADPNGSWQSCHQNGQAGEWQVFALARSLDETAAMLSISMGLAQVMGFNYASVGFASVQAMFAAYSAGAGAQIAGFFRFTETNGLANALRVGDYRTFAAGYNGAGWADQYAGLIQDRLALWRGLWGNRTVPAQAAGMAAMAAGMAAGATVGVGLPPAVAQTLPPVLAATLAEELRFLVQVGVIYEAGLQRLPKNDAINTGEVAAVTAWMRERLAALLGQR